MEHPTLSLAPSFSEVQQLRPAVLKQVTPPPYQTKAEGGICALLHDMPARAEPAALESPAANHDATPLNPPRASDRVIAAPDLVLTH